jgi:hypothetical protein
MSQPATAAPPEPLPSPIGTGPGDFLEGVSTGAKAVS